MPGGVRAAWTVRYRCSIDAVPRAAFVSLVDQLRAIADDLASLESTSAVWDHIGAAEKHLEAFGWRFAYRIPVKGTFLVTGAHVIPGCAGRSHATPVVAG